MKLVVVEHQSEHRRVKVILTTSHLLTLILDECLTDGIDFEGVCLSYCCRNLILSWRFKLLMQNLSTLRSALVEASKVHIIFVMAVLPSCHCC